MRIPPLHRKRAVYGAGAVIAALATIWGVSYQAEQETHAGATAIGTVCVRDLPDEAHTTIKAISEGGPYAHEKDGTVFQNREGLLPAHERGYYHEFTVETPGKSDRGARRIVTGGDIPDKVEDYYSTDHYASFELIDYKCGADSSPSASGADEPSPAATVKPPKGTDSSRVGAACYTSLNTETQRTLGLIWKSADDRSKFPYPDKDGSTFEWRENDQYPFPRKPDGYYKEWTVPTPGEDNRGRQRIVTGGDPKDRVEDYYTGDHYDTFEVIDYGC